MSGHTPGPWMILPSVTPSQFVILTKNGPRKDIACTYGFENDPREANARLIAAAPELLEVVNALLNDIGRDNSMPSAVNARAVLKKITGGASLIGLGKGDVALLANVDQSVPVAASGAQEENAVAVNLGLNSLEHDFEAAVPARPHSESPSMVRHRTSGSQS